MSLLEIALIILVLFFVQGVGLWLVLRKREEDKAPEQDATGMMLLQKQVQDMSRALDARVADSSKQMNDTMRSQLGESARLIKEITQEITSVKEIGRQTQTFAEQLQNLQDILKNPKQRGILGEYYLETVLKNVMSPEDYRIQYPFNNEK